MGRAIAGRKVCSFAFPLKYFESKLLLSMVFLCSVLFFFIVGVVFRGGHVYFRVRTNSL